jgi:hypothetical protein
LSCEKLGLTMNWAQYEEWTYKEQQFQNTKAKLGGQGGEVDDFANIANGEEQAFIVVGGPNKVSLKSIFNFVDQHVSGLWDLRLVFVVDVMHHSWWALFDLFVEW